MLAHLKILCKKRDFRTPWHWDSQLFWHVYNKIHLIRLFAHLLSHCVILQLFHMALFLPYVPLLLAFVSCPERSIDWSRERLLLLLLSKNKSWKYGWRTFFIVYSKLDFRYWVTLPCYQFTILFAEHNLLQLAYSAFSTTNPHKRNVRFWRKNSHLDNFHNCSLLKEQQFLCNMSCFFGWKNGCHTRF